MPSANFQEAQNGGFARLAITGFANGTRGSRAKLPGLHCKPKVLNRSLMRSAPSPYLLVMNQTICLLVAAAELACSGCNGKGVDSHKSESPNTASKPSLPIFEATRLNPKESFVQSENLERIYRRAVYDFADFEVKNADSVTPVRTWQLGQRTDEIQICGDRGIEDFMRLKPGQFAGVDFETPLGTKLINPEPFDSAKSGRTVIGLERVWHSEAKMRVQVALGYSNVISSTWTFLYEVDSQGRMSLRKSMNLGCNFVEGWMDDP